MILAVDVGLRTGLALFGTDGRLHWCRSHNLGQASRLRRAANNLLHRHSPDLLILEGGGRLADIWLATAKKQDIATLQIQAEEWRKKLLPLRQRTSGKLAKQEAYALARKIVEWSGAKRPTSLRHDAAEAVLAGVYGLLKTGILLHNPLASGIPPTQH
ncbi:hypothetical protein SAMN02745704_00225 [Paucidesulfovibrio gracilis DSM 16080]|uniref:Holliday junction resolvasome RuvABC endonuclease subunit n=1 Tax=Paucidesulfovibrio gracilis DSM 16080 TaxID=1121449 RepID=A0A1T4W4A2_9BACT|nr:hypothetical protein [Paucidesulfovibrio gracilis]SKA71865.1 hypothetical protein SAMN02745704_00225 [Paucidesulfovibrio gracilis DSM 16080]